MPAPKIIFKSFLLFSFFNLNTLECAAADVAKPVLAEQMVHYWQDPHSWKNPEEREKIKDFLQNGTIVSLQRMGADSEKTGRTYQFSTDVYKGIVRGLINGKPVELPVVFKTGYGHVERARMDAFAYNLASELNFPSVAPAVYKEHIEITPELKVGLISHPDGKHLEA